MQIYTTRKGERLGPFTIYKVAEMIDSGDLSPDDLGWHEGLDEWIAIKDIPAVSSTLKSLGKQRESTDASEGTANEATPSSPLLPTSSDDEKTAPAQVMKVHPFLRFWARFFDITLLNTFVWFVFDPPPLPNDMDKLLEFIDAMPQEERLRLILIWCSALFLWNFVEALLLSSFGTTPGKWLFNIKVTQKNGARLAYSEALGRSILVWLLGIGLGLDLLQMLTMAFSFFYLRSRGYTIWDRTLKTKIHHKVMSLERIMLAVFAYLFLFALQGLSLS